MRILDFIRSILMFLLKTPQSSLEKQKDREASQTIEVVTPEFIYPEEAGSWDLEFFMMREFFCKCNRKHKQIIYMPHAYKLDQLRRLLDTPIKINSAYRCTEHNIEIGGSKNSQHMLGKATDIRPLGPTSLDHVREKAIELGFDGIGAYKTFLHLDSRGNIARWDG